MQGSNRENIKLSIIIPYYNCYKYFIKLLEVLIPQITEEIEVLIIDDGCHENGRPGSLINKGESI